MSRSEKLFHTGRRILLFAIALTYGFAGPLRADDALDCAQQTDPDLAVRACTEIIINGYIGRGIAYAANGDHERAIADFEKAQQLDAAMMAGGCRKGPPTDDGIPGLGDRGGLCRR